MSITTHTDAAFLLNLLRQYDYDDLFDTDDDGNADTAAITFAIESGAVKYNFYGVNFDTDTAEMCNALFAIEFAQGISSHRVGPIPVGIQKMIDFWTDKCEDFSTSNDGICQMYNPEEEVTETYMDDLLKDPE